MKKIIAINLCSSFLQQRVGIFLALVYIFIACSCKISKSKKASYQPNIPEETEIFYLTDLDKIENILKLPENKEEMKGKNYKKLAKYLNDEGKKYFESAVDYLESGRGKNNYDANQVRELFLKHVKLNQLLIKKIKSSITGTLEESESLALHFAKKLRTFYAKNKIDSKKFLTSLFDTVKDEKSALAFIKSKFTTIQPSKWEEWEESFKIRSELNPAYILKHKGFLDPNSDTFKFLRYNFRDELFQYIVDLSGEQKEYIKADIQYKINNDKKYSRLKDIVILKGEKAKEIPFQLLMDSMVENPKVFGPYIIKKIQQEFTQVSFNKIDVASDIKNFLMKSKSRKIGESQALEYLERAKKIVPSLLKEGSKVLSAGSLGIVFQTHDNKILKWVPDDVIQSLNTERNRYIEIRDKLGSGIGLEYPEEIVRGNLQAEYRRRVYNLWQAKIDEIDEILAETNLEKEADNGVKASNYNIDITNKSGKKVGEIKAIGGTKVTDSMVDDSHVPDLTERFNLQDMAEGLSLDEFNLEKKHAEVKVEHRKQIQNSLKKLMDAHFHAIFSGQYFHGDLHEGNIKIVLNDEDMDEVKFMGLIDLGTIGRLDMYERQALKGIFDSGIAQKMIDDPALIKKIMTYNYIQLGDPAKTQLMKYHGFTPVILDDLEIDELKRIDTDVKYYMTGLSKAGFGHSVDALNLKEYGVFLNMFAGVPIPVDEPLRMLNLRPNVVSAFKAVSTGIGVIEASNKAAKRYSGSDLPAQVVRKTRADMFEYFSDTIKYKLKAEEKILLMDKSRLQHSWSGLPPEAVEYILAQNRKTGKQMDVTPDALWRRLLEVEKVNLEMGTELEVVKLQLEQKANQLLILNQQVQKSASPEETLRMQKEIEKLTLDINQNQKIYKQKIQQMDFDYKAQIHDLNEQLSQLRSSDSVQKQKVSQLTSDLQKKEEERLRLFNESNERFETIKQLQSEIDDLKSAGGDLEAETLAKNQFKRELELLKVTHGKLDVNSKRRIAELEFQLENQKQSMQTKINSLTQKNQLLSQKLSGMKHSDSEYNDLFRKFTDAQKSLEQMTQIQDENSRMKQDLKELQQSRDKVVQLQSELEQVNQKNSELLSQLSGTSSKQEVQILNQTIHENREKIKLLTFQVKEVETLRSQLLVQTQLASKLQSDLNIKTEEVATVQKNADQYRQQAKDLQKELDRRASFDEQVQKISELNQRNEQDRVKLEELERLKLENQEFKLKNKQLLSEIELEKQKAQKTKEALTLLKSNFTQYVNEAEAAKERLVNELRKKPGEQKVLQAQIDKLARDKKLAAERFNTEKAELSSQIDEVYKPKISQLSSQIDELMPELTSLRQKVKADAIELERLKKIELEFLDIKQQLTDARQTAELFKNKAQSLQVELDSLKVDYQKLMETNQVLTETNSRLQQELDLYKQTNMTPDEILEMQERMKLISAENQKLKLEMAELQDKNLELSKRPETRSIGTLIDEVSQPYRGGAGLVGTQTQGGFDMKPSNVPDKIKKVDGTTNTKAGGLIDQAYSKMGAVYFGVGALMIGGGAVMIYKGLEEANSINDDLK